GVPTERKWGRRTPGACRPSGRAGMGRNEGDAAYGITRTRPESTRRSRTTSRRVDSEGVRIIRAPRATAGIRLEVNILFLRVWHCGSSDRLMSWKETT